MASLGRLTIDLVANLGGFERDMGRAQRVTARSMGQVRRELRSAEREMEKARASLQRLGVQFAAVAGISLAAVTRELRNLSQQADNLDKLSRATGATVEGLQRLGFAAEQSGSSMDAVGRALIQMQRNIQGAEDGLSTYGDALRRVGLATQDLQNLSPEQQFVRIADAIANTSNQQAALTSATDLFGGRVARELLPLLRSGGDEIQRLGDQLAATGAIFSGEAVDSAVRFRDELNLLQRQFEAVRISMFSDVIGPLSDFVAFLNTEEGTRILRENLEALRTAAIAVGGVLATRFVVQLTAASIAMVQSTAQVLRLTAAKAGLAGTSATAATSVAALTMSLRTLMGPLGLAAIAIGAFIFASRDSVESLFDYEIAVQRLRVEMRNFRNEQEAAATRDFFAERLEQSRETLARMQDELGDLETRSRGAFDGVMTGVTAADARVIQLRQQIKEMIETIAEQERELTEAEQALVDYADAAAEAENRLRELNDAMDSRRVEAFRRRIEDLQDSLLGTEARALRRFVRGAEEALQMLEEGSITATEYAEAIDVLRQTFTRATEGVQDFNRMSVQTFLRLKDNADAAREFSRELFQLGRRGLFAATGGLIDIGGGTDDDVEETLAQAIERAVVQGFTRGIRQIDFDSASFGQIGGALARNLFADIGGAFGEAILGDAFESVGKSLGQKMGESIGDSFGEAFGEVAGAIGRVIGTAIFDRIFPSKDPKFQVGGAIGFARTGAGSIDMDLTGGPFGGLFVRLRKIEDDAADALRTSLRALDNTLASIIRDESQLQAATAALAQWGFDTADEGMTLQRVLESRFNAVLGTFDQFAQNMVREAATLDEQIARLADIIGIRARMMIGDTLGVIDPDTQIFLASSLARANETLAQSFERLLGITEQLQDLMALTGVQFAGGAVDLVRFGDALQSAFGEDLPRLNRGLQRVFDTFFDADEILERSAQVARERASALFQQLGVEITDAIFTAEGFRELFESLLPDISPEDLAILIEAGGSVADLIDALNQLGAAVDEVEETVAESAAVLAERAGLERRLMQLQGDIAGLRQMELDGLDESNRALLERIFALEDEQQAAREAEAAAAALARANQEAAAELERAANDFIGVMQGIEDSIALAPLNDFQRAMVQIERDLQSNIQAINQAAKSAISQATAEHALARAHQAAAVAAAAAVARLEASTQRLIVQVFGTPLDAINEQIQNLQNNSNTVADSINRAAEAMARLIAFADSLLVGPLSPLPSRQRLDVGMEQLREAAARGDVGAVQSLAQQVLQIGRERFATGPEFQQLFDSVQQILRDTVPAIDEPQPVEIVSSPELVALFQERDRLEAEQREADRRATSFDIAQSVADIAAATGESFGEVAERLGLNLSELADVLGIDIEQLDSLLESLMVDTSAIGRNMESFARDVRDAILEMTQFITGVLSDPITPSPGGDARQPIAVEPDLPRPPSSGDFTVTPFKPDPGKPDPTAGLLADIARNTGDTARGLDQIARDSRTDVTRSIRTALA